MIPAAVKAASGLALAAFVLQPTPALAQNLGFETQGSESFYWHGRYHGLITMAAYANDTEAVCRQTFTMESLANNFPESDATETFEIVNRWGPTERFGLSGFEVKVPEMNKILTVFNDVYGWQEFNATLIPFPDIGCDDCMVHAGAYEAFKEAENATNSWEVLQREQGGLVWSSAGHGFGGMVAQAHALKYKYDEMLWSVKTFGSPPVFNSASAAMFDRLIVSDASQRYIFEEDSVPGMIPVGEGSDYVFVNTGIHLHGSNPMYGLDYTVCYDPVDPVCHGGDNPADHYFYFTELGHCGEDGYTETVNRNITEENLNSLESEFYATAEVSTLASTADPDAEPSTTSSASTETSSASENDDDVRQDNVSEVSSVVNDSQDDEDSSASVLSHAITFIGVVGAVAFAF